LVVVVVVELIELPAGALVMGALLAGADIIELLVSVVVVLVVVLPLLQAARLAAASSATEARAKVRTCVMWGSPVFERKENEVGY
jgi:hypothetical protein